MGVANVLAMGIGLQAGFSQEEACKVVIVGGGIIGALESYSAYLESLENKSPIHVIVYEKGAPFEEGAPTNTAYHISPSLTPDEILSVVPRGTELIEKLGFLFNEPGGIRVDDVSEVNDSPAAIQFKERVVSYGQDLEHEDRTHHLLALGKRSMDLWQHLYDQADAELKRILSVSNFYPCYEPEEGKRTVLHNGYRVDLIYGIPDAAAQAEKMRQIYHQLGYVGSKPLSPGETIKLDPALVDFCRDNSIWNREGHAVWKENAIALWRPGRCLATLDFLPLFYEYLRKVMGTYEDASGQILDCFSLNWGKEVVGVELDNAFQITALEFRDGSRERENPQNCHYVFCPGESVGTLKKLGFQEPAYAGFAGPALTLRVPLSPAQVEIYKDLSHCMEVHKLGIVLAWQARCKEDHILLQVGGTKAFYGDRVPRVEEAFATDRHLVQLNIINDVLPEVVSIAFKRDTRGKALSLEDLYALEREGILERWVGRRAVAYDGFPTLGALYVGDSKIKNGRCTTHMGSGGVSFAPAAIEISRCFERIEDPFVEKILQYADSRR